MPAKIKKEKQDKDSVIEQDLKTEEINSEETKEDTSQETDKTVEEPVFEESIASKLETEVFEYRDKLVRKAAEFENYKKRTSEEFLRLIETATENLIIKLLPIIDDMHRFQDNYKSEMKSEDLKKGIDLIFGKYMDILKNSGLEEIEVIGKEFNPELHEALLQVENPDVKSDHIVDQHEKGYTLRNKVIRHSKVIVAK
ncbi:MAG: nucleotide exchange factor GrpE [Candidatus Delongbacteria bacterium]|jgi:molecular chaperone GrpE|nr:nucleotide exchange factor GrpE [Candidatus Delongbacteria bacterium]